MNFKDESGIAYGIFIIATFFVLAGSYMILNIPFFNGLTNVFNVYIGEGMVTTETSDAWNIFRKFVVFSPVIVLIGAALWGWVRALEKKYQEGS